MYLIPGEKCLINKNRLCSKNASRTYKTASYPYQNNPGYGTDPGLIPRFVFLFFIPFFLLLFDLISTSDLFFKYFGWNVAGRPL